MKTAVQFFHPFDLFVIDLNELDDNDPSNDVRRYGIAFDLTTECYFYTYDWGYGVNLRLFGFGVEIARYEA